VSWWYRTEFTAPAAEVKEARYGFTSAGINYRADLWLNGHKIRKQLRSLSHLCH